MKRFCAAWKSVIKTYSILRAGYSWENSTRPLQFVRDLVTCEILELEANMSNFDLNSPPLMRLYLQKINDNEHQFTWIYHHIILDGWSADLLLQKVFQQYRNSDKEIVEQYPYHNFIVWLSQQDIKQAKNFWRNYLEG